ncbi:hypothetical protein ABZ565_03865 [Streptomyces sp. NPDC016469]|uniref:hypothetical protein n=1 Tax=Streptomyces sp. NPDC016469 TaxID=3157191 RepID=UPI0033E92138
MARLLADAGRTEEAIAVLQHDDRRKAVVEFDLLLAAWKHSSTFQRAPVTRTSSDWGTAVGDQQR